MSEGEERRVVSGRKEGGRKNGRERGGGREEGREGEERLCECKSLGLQLPYQFY